MPMASSMVPLHFWSRYSQHEVQPDFLGYAMHLVLGVAACDADVTVNSMIALISHDDQNDMEHDFFW